MPRIRRLHQLEPAEQEYVQFSLGLIRENINTLYTLVDQRFGISNKRALRLQALKRKFVEVESLFTEITSSESGASM